MSIKNKPIQLEIFEKELKGNLKRIDKQRNNPSAQPQQQKSFSKIYIIASCFLLLAITSFALGVERGKTIAKNRETSHRYLAKEKKEVAAQAPIEQKTKKEVTKTKQVQKKPEKKRIESKETFKGYIIQVVTYRKDSSYAKKETSHLKEKGYEVVLIPSGQYLQIGAGTFSSKKDAMPHLKKLKKEYKDCYIRKI